MKRLSIFVCAAALMTTGAYAGGMMDRVDANKDGKITMQEAETAQAARFAEVDSNKDGFIEASEALKAKKENRGKMQERRAGAGMLQGGKPMFGPEGRGPDMMMQADADKDGKITRAEFAAASNERFQDTDFNKDGVIDRSDFEAHRAACESGAALCGPLARLDENKDGKVSKTEFMKKPNPMFERADANKDGVIDMAEMAAAKKERRFGPGMGPDGPPAL